MPIKFPRGFQRRKSSGPALEEIPNPPEPTFRVFERPHNASKSFDGGHVLRKSVIAIEERVVASPRAGSKDDNEPLFPVSGAEPGNRTSTWTHNSGSTTAPYSSAASSVRLSSSSTIPSSSDTRSDTSAASGNPKPFHDIPVPPAPTSRTPFSLRSSARTFSFGNKTGALPSITSQTPLPSAPGAAPKIDNGRDRAMSSSTASTATPPKLLDAELAFGDSDADGFSSMFDSIGKRNSRITSQRQDLSENIFSSSPHRPGHIRPQTLTPPSTIDTGRGRLVQSSPFSQNGHDSRKELTRSPGLISSESHPASQNVSGANSLTDGNEEDSIGHVDGQHPGNDTSGTPRRTSNIMRNRRQSFQQVRRLDRNGNGPPSTASTLQKTTSRTSNSDSIQKSDIASSPTSPTFAADALLAAEWEHKEHMRPAVTKPTTPNKVMTPAQFERYRQQQEMERKRTETANSDQSGDDSDSYEDEDEAERDRRVTAQRRKQEAQLAVYRQTMMKVTGEQSSQSRNGSTERLGSRIQSSSSLDMTKSVSNLTLDPKASAANGKSSGEEDEDEDVPLGILAAHGFPHKNRPPTRLSNQSSNPNLRAISPGAAPVAGDPKQASKGGLPPFARHLPQDPYFGASLVNQSNRESFAMGGGSSVYGGQLPGTPPGLHPAGLVGVIAGEERARAMRRGSPNASGSYEMSPGMMRSQTMGNIPMVPAPGMVPGMALPLTPGDQAQIQMTQQMSQMMQMQMQWMQQMSQIVQQGQGQPMPPPPQFVQQPSATPGSPGLLAPPGQIPRPMSMPMPEIGPPRMGQRAMSTLTPSMASWNTPHSFTPTVQVSAPGGGPGYTPSIAPSERSNVGLASRYRPVSIAPSGGAHPASKRASTFTAGTVQPPWTDGVAGRRSPGALSTIRPIGGRQATDRKQSGQAVPDDDDDDQGWAEMKQKRDKKKNNWKLKKAQTQSAGLEDLYHG